MSLAKRRGRAWLILAGLVVMSSLPAQAQSSGGQPDQPKQPMQAKPAGPNEEAAKPAAKPDRTWSANITAGGQLSRGQTDANAFNVMTEIVRKSLLRSYHITGSLTFASVKAPGTPERFTASDRRYADFFFMQKLNSRLSFVTRTGGEHDYARGLRYRAENLTGVGIAATRGERVTLMITPGGIAGIEDKLGVRHNSGYFGPGLYQRLAIKINAVWSFQQWFMYRQDARNAHDYRLDGYAGITGFVFTRRLGFNVGYSHNYDGIVSPGLMRQYALLTTGVRYVLQ